VISTYTTVRSLVGNVAENTGDPAGRWAESWRKAISHCAADPICSEQPSRSADADAACRADCASLSGDPQLLAGRGLPTAQVTEAGQPTIGEHKTELLAHQRARAR